MRYAIRGSLALFTACVLLGAGQAIAAPGEATPAAPVPATVDGAQPPNADADHELTDAEKGALAKRRLERCRLHPGTCEQGAKHAKDGKGKPEPVVSSGAPVETGQK